jgi:hypothetical protein
VDLEVWSIGSEVQISSNLGLRGEPLEILPRLLESRVNPDRLLELPPRLLDLAELLVRDSAVVERRDVGRVEPQGLGEAQTPLRSLTGLT